MDNTSSLCIYFDLQMWEIIKSQEAYEVNMIMSVDSPVTVATFPARDSFESWTMTVTSSTFGLTLTR